MNPTLDAYERDRHRRSFWAFLGRASLIALIAFLMLWTFGSP